MIHSPSSYFVNKHIVLYLRGLAWRYGMVVLVWDFIYLFFGDLFTFELYLQWSWPCFFFRCFVIFGRANLGIWALQNSDCAPQKIRDRFKDGRNSGGLRAWSSRCPKNSDIGVVMGRAGRWSLVFWEDDLLLTRENQLVATRLIYLVNIFAPRNVPTTKI